MVTLALPQAEGDTENGMGGGAGWGLGRRGAAAFPAYYRRQAARARQVAERVTTRAMRTRLLEEAVYCDELAAQADRAAGERERP